MADDALHVWCDYAGVVPADAAGLLAALPRFGIFASRMSPCSHAAGLLFAGGDDTLTVSRLREHALGHTARVIVVSMAGNGARVRDGWQFLEVGAADVLRLGDAGETAEAIAARFRRWSVVDDILESPLVRSNLVGESRLWRQFLAGVADVARFSDMPVLICGESGTGKELVARLIHTLDGRRGKRELVVVDCTTVVPELSGSEFFGHERGAYTGAVGDRDGAFALANGGTLFLDEVGDLPPRLQAELLRVVQEGTYKRVGGNTWQRTAFRLVCATHRDLGEEVAAGRFRGDLYYRLAAWTCRVPPLRERREDIPALVRHFLRARRERPVAIDEAVIDFLVSRDYEGNVRDLQHAVERIAQRHAGDGPITIGDVPEDERPHARPAPARWVAAERFEDAARLALLSGMGLKEIANAAADASVRLALDFENGNVGRAAERLRITDRGLQKRRALWRHGDDLRPRP